MPISDEVAQVVDTAGEKDIVPLRRSATSLKVLVFSYCDLRSRKMYQEAQEAKLARRAYPSSKVLFENDNSTITNALRPNAFA